MQVNFLEIINEVLTQMGKTSDSAESTVLDSVKLRINQIQSKIYFSDNWEWRKQRYYFTTREPITAGTITVTENSKAVTGSGTSFTDIIKYGSLIVGDKVFKIDPHTAVTSTSFSLVAPYTGSTEAGKSYKIVFPDYLLDPEVSGLVSVFLNSREIEIKHQDRMSLDRIAAGEPCEATIMKRADFDYYTEGTVDVTNGSKTVTGTGTTFTSDMEGMPFRVNEFAELYTIHSVDSATQLTLRQSYSGDTGSGKSYKIAPKGSLMITLSTYPDKLYFIEMEALRAPRKLVSNNDESDIPNHTALIHGAIWLALRDLENKPVSQIQNAERVYQNSLRELKELYRVVKNVKWINENEIRHRSSSVRFPFRPFGSNTQGWS